MIVRRVINCGSFLWSTFLVVMDVLRILGCRIARRPVYIIVAGPLSIILRTCHD